jgi:hypothetical protein
MLYHIGQNETSGVEQFAEADRWRGGLAPPLDRRKK